jgi:tRNA nucleotidyltransferase (CCA-adding enzyme)
MKIYRVGGSVRDELLGLPVKDQDWVVVGGTPEQMEALGYRPIGKDFPVFLHPGSKEEYALARTERKTGRGYKGFSFHTAPDISLEQDLQRRDLTINAMAMDENGNLIDPYHGKADLEHGVLRHVSPAFREDPLRLLRVARFAARFGFLIAPETRALMQQIAASGELETLVAERIWQETERALGATAAVVFFEVLRECGALAAVFPELDRLFGVPQPQKYHPEIDSGVHTLMVLHQACMLADDTVVRFAALVHDLGKGTTPVAELPAHRGHETRGVTIIHSLCDRCRIPNKYRELAVLVARYHLDCHRLRALRPATIYHRLQAMDVFRRPHRLEQFLLACTADARGRAGMEKAPYPQAELFRNYYQAVAAVDARAPELAEYQGAELGQALQKARIEAIKQLQSAAT